MMSRSYTNLFELASGEAPLPSSGFSRAAKKLSRVATVPGVLSELDDEGFSSDAPSSVCQERMIIVGNQLPLWAHKGPDGSWNFGWDEDSLLLQLRDGLGEDGINKGLVADRLLTTMKQRGMLPDFVLCIGDDKSDEDMFEAITRAVSGPALSPVAEVFACTVGRKPSKARYFLEDTTEILRMLQGLSAASELHSLKTYRKVFRKWSSSRGWVYRTDIVRVRGCL